MGLSWVVYDKINSFSYNSGVLKSYIRVLGELCPSQSLEGCGWTLSLFLPTIMTPTISSHVAVKQSPCTDGFSHVSLCLTYVSSGSYVTQDHLILTSFNYIYKDSIFPNKVTFIATMDMWTHLFGACHLMHHTVLPTKSRALGLWPRDLWLTKSGNFYDFRV